jgi:tubulin polyglutamylase complex subunit 2
VRRSTHAVFLGLGYSSLPLTCLFSLCSFLENHACVSDVQLTERAGVTARDISGWEKTNQPTKLPVDLRAFLQLFDGLELRWKIQYQGRPIPLGWMHLNQLHEIKAVPNPPYCKRGPTNGSQSLELIQDPESDEDDEGSDSTVSGPKLKTTLPVYSLTCCMCCHSLQAPFLAGAAFVLDHVTNSGQVCLVYDTKSSTTPQVWFQDLSCSWHFVAPTFTHYFRLMIMHLGIPGWHYAFTEVGLDPSTQQWFRLLSPERLAIDMAAHQAKYGSKQGYGGHGGGGGGKEGAEGTAEEAAAAAAARTGGAPPKPPNSRNTV